MIQSKFSRTKSLIKITILLLVSSIILAIPLFLVTKDWSMHVSRDFYGRITRIIHVHSPNKVYIDEDGIPAVDLGYQSGKYIGLQRNPLTIATQALTYYDQFSKTGKSIDKQHFLNCIYWLDNAAIDRDEYALWAYEFEDLAFNAKPPFYSGMAQARIMVALQRAYDLTGDDHYLQMAFKAMRALEVPIEDGGVLYIDVVDGGKWYEEIAGGGSYISHILNGFIWSLFDLNDFYNKTGSQEAKSLFDDGLTEIKRHISEYDTGHWTKYDLIGHLSYDYHYVHIYQMQKLYEITGDAMFKTYHKKWASYFPINPMWARQRFAGYLFDVAIIFVGLSLITVVYKKLPANKNRIKIFKEVQTKDVDS